MCNDFGNHVPYAEYVAALEAIGRPLAGREAAPNLEPRDEIWPTDLAAILRPEGDGTMLERLPWGLAAHRAGAPPVINLRSEGRRFDGGRCLVPASHYYEFTGKRSPKTRWRFTRADGAWFCFAGFVGRGPAGPAFALLTADAGPDVAPVHTRQPVLLERAAWAAWLGGGEVALGPSPAGSLRVEEAPRERRLI